MRSNITISQRIIAVLIAAWIPFCCCTLKVAASMVQDADSTPLLGSCCCSQDTAPCDGEDSGPEEGSDKACSICCLKVMPDPPQDWDPPIVLLELPQSLAMSSLLVDTGNEARTTLPARPPDLPARDTLLEQHALLLV